MSAFNFYIPTRIQSGCGLAKETGKLLKPYGITKLLIVTDPGLRATPVVDVVLQSLKAAEIGYEIFSEVEPNPTTDVLDAAVAFIKQTGCDAVLGLGGGSSIDTAKGVAAMATNPGGILDYEGYEKLKATPLPLFVIPTTAGTGSECTASTVFTNTQTRFKTVIVSALLLPKLAILDAELTLKLPPEITAATGMDAMTHAIESYVSKQANPISQSMALHAIKLISQSLYKAYVVGSDVQAREDMLVGSLLAGMAFAQSKLGNVHAISHTFGGVFNIPHGIANAALLPYVIDFNIPACPEKFRDIAIAMGQDVSGLSAIDAARAVVKAVIELNAKLGIPSNTKDLGVNLGALPKMIEDSMRSGNVLVNPRITRAHDVKLIIENAYHGMF
ncbi:iron-containing alcohol dehydrogenase [Comamonas thiooxydans]|nr:iron-containing alcohol dehydrogenase [Comamonas thiooxydans]MDO1476443.1 iron-containing alcohol dehydrogenase [Comamonas thiooxydans]